MVRSVIRKSDSYGTYRDCLVCGWHGYDDAVVAEAPDGREEDFRRPGVERDSRVGVAS